MRHSTVILGVLTLALTVPAAAQEAKPKPLPVDARKLLPHRDSLAVLVNNQPRGRSVFELRKGGDSLVVHELTVIGAAMRQETTSDLNARGEVLRVSQSGMVRDIPGGIELVYAGGRVTGQVQAVTANGSEHFAVDTTVPPGTVDDNTLQALLPALPWSKDAAWLFPMFSAGSKSLTSMILEVVGEETVMVPAGAFDAWVVRLSGGANYVTFRVLKRAPHTVLKVEVDGAPLKLELVSGGGL